MRALLITAVFLALTADAQTNFDWGVNASAGAQYLKGTYQIFNIGVDPSQYATYRNSQNVFNLGADCAWQSSYWDSFNIINIGIAAGESQTVSQCSDMIFSGSEAGMSGNFSGSKYVYMHGHNAGYGTSLSRSFDVYALGGLQAASLWNSRGVTAIGPGAGYGLSGQYTNVVLVGSGATLGGAGKDVFALGSGMKARLGTTNEWQFGEATTNSLRVTVNGRDYIITATPANQ